MYYQNLYYLFPLQSNSENTLDNTTSNGYQNDYRTKKTDNEKLYDPLTGLVYGNMFKKEYRGYKDYQPGISKPKTEKEQLMLDLMMYSNAAHDIALKLDVTPNDAYLLKEFSMYNSKYAEIKKICEDKYGPLQKSDAGSVNGEFNWIKVNSPWMTR